ncbi:MAG: PspC domain-containing protein [Sphaerochaetaceae bacterium]
MATKRLYRSRRGKIFGVCQGIADWRDLPVDILRAITAVSIIVTGIFPGIVIYALIALFLPLEPGYGTQYEESEHNQEERGPFNRTREDLRETFENLKRKVEGMEENIFDKERDWDQRFHGDQK